MELVDDPLLERAVARLIFELDVVVRFRAVGTVPVHVQVDIGVGAGPLFGARLDDDLPRYLGLSGGHSALVAARAGKERDLEGTIVLLLIEPPLRGEDVALAGQRRVDLDAIK